MKNIRLAYGLTFLSECYWPSIPALFFYLRYFSFAEIATLWAIQMAVSNLMEIPTGAFADIVGRKKSIILSFVIGAVSLAIFPFTTAFGVFVVLEALKGLSNALYSGSMEALAYDSLKEVGEEKTYPRIAANMETVTWACWALSSVGGAYLFTLHYQLPWLVQAAMFVGAFMVSLGLTEPRIDSVKVKVAQALSQNLAGFRELFASPRLTKITLILVTIGAGYIIASNLLGPSQAREYGMGPTGTGWLFGIGCLVSVAASRYFPALLKRLGQRKLVVITGSMLIASFAAAKFVGLGAGVGLILMRIASSSTFRNTRSVIVNSWVKSENRATALSTLNLLTQSPYMLLAPLMGWLMDKSSPNQLAWGLGLAIFSLVGLLAIYPVRMKERAKIWRGV